MRKIERAYIGGKLEVPHGTELFNLFNPSDEEVVGQVRLADEEDGRAAIAAAKKDRGLAETSLCEQAGLTREQLEALVKPPAPG